MGHVEAVPKKFKNFSTFRQKLAKKNREKLSQHAAQLIGVPSIIAKN